MKVIAKREYYEKDFYKIHQNFFSLDEMPTKKDAVLVHKKGDLADYDFQKKYCCPRGRAHIEYKGQWFDPADRIVPGAFLFLNNDDERIQYCPFCGEKIEVVEEE